MKIGEAFPSAFLKASDLGGRDVTVTIESVSMEELGQGRDKETKLLVSFVGKQKKLVCNKTNASTIAKLHGDDTDNWIGKPIVLTAREVEYQGEMTLAIRVSLQKPAPKAGAKAAPAPEPEPDSDDGGDTDAPF
jgi:hypothetical protein